MPGTVSPQPWVSDPDMHYGTCVTHVPWCMPGSLTNGLFWSRWRENVPGIPRACTIRNFTYLIRGPWHISFDWRRQTASPYLSWCWPSPIMSHSVTWPRFVTSRHARNLSADCPNIFINVILLMRLIRNIFIARALTDGVFNFKFPILRDRAGCFWYRPVDKSLLWD